MTNSNKNAVVTGTSGIALAVAQRLLREGYAVTLCGNDKEQNAAAEVTLAGMPADVAAVDVSDAGAVERFAANLGKRIDALHVLVNCAAIQPYGNLETTTPLEWEKTIGINLTGYFHMAHFLYPLLKKAGSASIVNFASVQGHMNQNNVLAYATSKGAIHALTRAMAVDCAKDGIRVNSISPGSIRSPMLEFAARSLTPDGGDWEETLAGFGRAHSAGRVGTMDEVAGLVAYLVGPESGFSIGSDFAIDGGLRAKLAV